MLFVVVVVVVVVVVIVVQLLFLFCDFATGVETWQLIYNASLVEWFFCRLQGSREFGVNSLQVLNFI